ncbi:hypothetical protein JAAARDRAFT_191003 [Jaapia argillacea MUCL 33604]|uniref:O-methyltransferase domain-containing protein n=1 Tax=Jaapia argillacea MUCL 33604 TaxID=933084 RepID=A0A067Q1K3_9AGAM|nr:hypothetical protein JAAARDRAFT_191003 [Jaapia argillacea MUCL 33604]
MSYFAKSWKFPAQLLTPTTLDDWVRECEYHKQFLIGEDEAIEYALKNSTEHGLPDVSVTPAQGKLMKFIAESIGAKRILEVGTLGGYSAIFFARALPPGGQMITLELSQEFAKVAAQNIAHAGLADKVKIIVGPAGDSMKAMHPEELFDLVFVDADKKGNPTYYTEARRLTRKGGVIIVDNVFRNCRVSDMSIKDAADLPDLEGIRTLLQMVKDDPGVDATSIPTAGEKGYDGFMYIKVL